MQSTKTKKKVKNKKKIRRSSRQKKAYSGKSRRHSHKIQVVDDADTQEIYCLHFAKGSCHDFNLYKKSNLRVDKKIKKRVDKGYIGIIGFHTNTDIPKKSSKKNPLTKEDKKNNKKLSKERVGIEHTNRKIKIFRVMKEVYRNHNHFELRATLIACIHNHNLTINVA